MTDVNILLLSYCDCGICTGSLSGYTLILFVAHVTIQSRAKMFVSQSYNAFFKSCHGGLLVFTVCTELIISF